MEERGRHIPIAVGSVLIVVGLLLAWLGSREPEPTSPAPSVPTDAPPEPTAEPTALREEEPEEEPELEPPDLSGPDLGALVVPDASDAHGLSAREGRLVWITTEGAVVASARYDGGDAVVLHRDGRADRFGGAFARDRRGVYFSVAGGDDPEPIFFIPADDLDAAGELSPIAHGGSPDAFVATGDVFAWSDLGTIRRLAPGGEPVEVARRSARIAAMTASGDDLYWIETPYAGKGAHALVTAPLGGGAPRVLDDLPAAERDQLAAVGDALVWSEETRLLRFDPATKAQATLARTGIVTALSVAGDRIFWAERHGDDDAPVTLLRSVAAGSEPLRLGRRGGTITALAVADGFLFFSGSEGIYRAPLEPSEPK